MRSPYRSTCAPVSNPTVPDPSVPDSHDPLREETLHSEHLYQGRILNLRRDHVRLADGRESTREVVEHRGAVVVLALMEGGRIPFVRQWRAPAGRALLELPAGTLEAGEEPEHAARRELAEEVGLSPGTLEPLLGFWVAPGWAEEFLHAFFASDCTPVDRHPDHDEILQVEGYTLGEAMDLVRAGEIQDAKSLVLLQALALRAVGPLGQKVIRFYRGD